jgi:hypothetical protein
MPPWGIPKPSDFQRRQRALDEYNQLGETVRQAGFAYLVMQHAPAPNASLAEIEGAISDLRCDYLVALKVNPYVQETD